MSLSGFDIHLERIVLNNELHARPFPVVRAPGSAASIAIERDADRPDADRAHLLALMDRYGVAHPAPSTSHHSVDLGKVRLKWERHSEFVTYTVFADHVLDEPFSGGLFQHFPEEWRAASPGRFLSSILVRIESVPTPEAAIKRVQKVGSDWFHDEAMAASFVLEKEAAIVGGSIGCAGAHSVCGIPNR